LWFQRVDKTDAQGIQGDSVPCVDKGIAGALIMVKVQKLPNGQLVITIPKQIALLKNWGKSTILTFQDLDKDSIIIRLSKEKNVKK